jgi:hypothetical protein
MLPADNIRLVGTTCCESVGVEIFTRAVMHIVPRIQVPLIKPYRYEDYERGGAISQSVLGNIQRHNCVRNLLRNFEFGISFTSALPKLIELNLLHLVSILFIRNRK